jgi:competence protein ComEA
MKERFATPYGRSLAIIFLSWLLVAAQISCVRLPRHTASLSGQNGPAPTPVNPSSQTFININTATSAELEKLPGIGEGLAARIIEHREKYGRFRRVEHLLMVRGISERRYQAISALLKVE